MASDYEVGLLGAKGDMTVTITSPDSRPNSYYGRHSRNSSGMGGMERIDESREADIAQSSRYMNQYLNVDESQSHHPRSSSPSILRRLSTRLLTPAAGSRFLSTRRSRGRDYANLQESEADIVAVDLSSLEGLGYELYEGQSRSTEHLASQDTSYQSPNTSAARADFNQFRHRQTLGSGMRIGAELKRDPSKINRGLSTASAMSIAENIQRSRTVKDFGQNLADQRNMIVAVSEPIDLSLLEGGSVKNRASQTFDSIVSNRDSPTNENPQSYFFPADPHVPNWRPFSMRKPYIIGLILIAFGLAGFQEYLCQLSIRKSHADPPTGLLSFNEVAQVSTLDFFVWKYLPTMITIIYAVLFSIMDFDIRRLEPYYQLSQPQGSRASASLNLDHLTMFQYFVPFKSMRLRQWAVFASTIANITAATVAPALQNPSVNFTQNNGCQPGSCPEGEQQYWVQIHPIWSRFLSASYLVIGFITVFLFFQLRRKSGLLSDPKGIAGIASMATKSHILQDFKGLDAATRGDIHKKLAHRRYILYKSSIWQGEWNAKSEPPQDSASRLRSPHPIMLRLEAGIPFILIMVGCLVAVPVISLTPGRAIPNAVPWLPILIATLVKLVWSTFEADVRLIEPFYQLSKGHARPENSLTLDYQATVYGWMPIRAALNGHYLVALVGLASVCLDVLAVTVSSFSVDSQVFLKHEGAGQDTSNQDETYISFWTSEALSIIILIFAIATACLVYARRRHPFLPREPSTIAAVLSFIFASKMLDDFIDTETLTNRAMEARLKAIGKTYALGWFTGRDGQPHCAIDEEPMRSKYVHGKPLFDAVAGPLQSYETL